MSDTFPNPVQELQLNAKVPFEQARAMPKSVYTSKDFLAQEIEHVFAQEWFCAGRASSLKQRGDYITLELAGQPIMVVRDGNGELRAQSNVCLHRMSTLLEGAGNTRSIVCPVSCLDLQPGRQPARRTGHDPERGLRQAGLLPAAVRCEEWLGWIMVSLNPDAAPASQRLSEVEDLVGQYGMENYTETFRETHVWDTNWKVLAENFMESYHLPVCHAGTIGGLSKLEEMDCPPGKEAFNYHFILKDDTLKIALAHPHNTRLEGDWRRTTSLLAIYPSLLITLTPGYFWYLSLHPRGVNRAGAASFFGGGMSPEYRQRPECAGPASNSSRPCWTTSMSKASRLHRKGLSRPVFRSGHTRASCRTWSGPNYDFARYLSQRICP